jgi:predicted unusual protein kinase regulating ubiquinone biosynthesis (AarF/ABC1/UbiB family)
MFNNIKKCWISLNWFLNNIWFLISIFWIICDEMSYYYVFKNQDKLVNNLTKRLAYQNILCVKIFQAFALNNNIFSEQKMNYLIKYTDSVPWTNKDIDLQTLIQLEKSFNLEILNNYKPIKSGMISLVFKCINKNKMDETMILKIKRNNIETILNEGIQKMLFCITLLSFIPIVNNYQISKIIHDNIHLINQQIDFKKEVQNISIIKKNCKNLKYVKIPFVYEEVTSQFSNVIMMEYIKGLTIKEIKVADHDEYSKQIIKFVLVTTLINGTCHGDLHMGNILFIKDENDTKYKYKIGVLDFGIVYEIDKMKNTLYYIFANMYTDLPEKIAQNLLESGIVEPAEYIIKLPNHHLKCMLVILTNFINDTIYVSKHLSQINIFKALYDLNDYIVENNLIVDGIQIKPCDDLIKIQVIFTMLYGVIFKLCDTNYLEITNKVMIDLFHIDVSES